MGASSNALTGIVYQCHVVYGRSITTKTISVWLLFYIDQTASINPVSMMQVQSQPEAYIGEERCADVLYVVQLHGSVRATFFSLASTTKF